MAVAAFGRQLGEEFQMPVALNGTRRWCGAEIKHKYLHALHDVMENFENRFPDAKGFYSITMQEGDIQPALEQVRRVAERNRNRADLYLKHNCPISFVVSKGDRDTIRFVEYIRFLDFDIRACLGNEPERAAARSLLDTNRHSGAVLDAYAAWTIATMDAFDVLQSVFGKLIVPQTVIDEIRSLRDEQETTAERSMTMTWHNGQYIRQEHTAQDIAARRDTLSSSSHGSRRPAMFAPSWLLTIKRDCLPHHPVVPTMFSIPPTWPGRPSPHSETYYRQFARAAAPRTACGERSSHAHERSDRQSPLCRSW